VRYHSVAEEDPSSCNNGVSNRARGLRSPRPVDESKRICSTRLLCRVSGHRR
jgi:hypothetical protein